MNPRRALRSPLLHFLLIGGLLFALLQGRGPRGSEPIEISAAAVQHLRADWMRETGRSPNAQELRASLRRHADREMLLREALRLGLDRRDPVVRERLLLNIGFLWPDARLRTEQALGEARRLGMVERDLVVQRRLVQLMEARLAELEAVTVSRSDLPAKSRLQERRTFTQAWFSQSADSEAKLAAALARLQGGADADAAAEGEPFLLGRDFAVMSEIDIARRFGPGFAAALMQLPVGQWSGPLRSPYGLHLVRVGRVEPASESGFSARGRAYQALAKRETQQLADALKPLRARYPLVVEGDPS